MSTTPILGIIELESSQSQPEVVVNAALRVLEAFASRAAVSRTTNNVPASPDDGDVYIIPSNAIGTWSPYAFYVAISVNGVWQYIPPRAGWVFYVTDEDKYYEYLTGSPNAWAEKL